MKEQNPNKVPAYYPQSCGNAYSYGREPTGEELVNQVYQAWALEIWNIIFFANVPLSEETFPAMRKLKAERDEFLEREDFLSGEPVQVNCSSQKISLTARSRNGYATVISVNTTREEVNAVFSIPDAESGSVKFENRPLSVHDGSWSDRFAPLERHVYKIKLKSPESSPENAI